MSQNQIDGHPAIGTDELYNSSKQLAVSSQLMQSYRLATPFPVGTQIATAFNGSTNQTEVFSIGNNGHIYNVYPDSNSDTGWSMVDLNFPAQAKYIATGGYPDGSIIVYAVDTNNNIYSNRGGQKWGSGWQSLEISKYYAEYHIPANSVIRGIKVAYDNTNTPGAMIVSTYPASSGNHTAYSFATLIGNDWVFFGMSTVALNDGSPGYDWHAGFVETPDDAGSIGVYTSTISQFLSYCAKIPYWDYCPAADGAYSAIASAKNSKGFDEPFAVSRQDSGIYYLVLDMKIPQPFTASKISGDTAVSTIVAASDAKGQMEVFALGTDQYLYHGRQDQKSETGWSVFLQLEQDLKFTQLIAGTYAEVFAVTTDNKLYHIWQDTENSEWSFDEVELAQNGTIEEISAYNLQIKVFDANQVAVRNTPIKIFTEEPVQLEINGVSCFLDRGRPWQGQSNIVGELTVAMQTDSLGFSPLNMWTSFMPPNDRIALDASAPIQEKLVAITADQLLDTYDDQGNQVPLLSGQANRDPKMVANLAQAINRTMSLTLLKNLEPPRDCFHRLNDHRVTNYLLNYNGGPLGCINAAAVPEQHWQVDFSSGKPVFRDLTRQEAERLIAANQALPSAALFLGLDLDWGDVFDAIVDGTASIFDWVVTKVEEGIHIVFTLVIKGSKYVYDTVISLVEQAIDLVEELFQWVEVKFEQLFRWLADLFPWQDIFRAKDVLKYAFNQMLQFAEAGVPKIEELITGKIDNFEQSIQQTFADFNKYILGTQTTVGANRSRQDQVPAAAELNLNRAGGLNIFQSSFINNFDKVSAANQGMALVLPAETSLALDNIITQLTAYAEQFRSAQAFQDAINYFMQIKDDPEHFLQLAISGLLAIFEGLTLLVLDIAKELIHLLSAAIVDILTDLGTVLNANLSIPFVSDLYAHLTGSELTILDFFALLVATPATILYKLVFKAAPFPDAAAVQTFETSFTSNIFLQQSGLGALPANFQTVSLQNQTSVVAGFEKFFQICNSINNGVYTVVDVILDLQLTPAFLKKYPDAPGITSAPGKVAIAGNIALANGWFGWLFAMPWPTWVAGEGKPGCGNHKEFGTLHWMLQFFPNLVDTAWVAKFEQLTRSGGNVGPILASVFGTTDLILTITEGAWAAKDNDGDVFGTLEGVFGTIPGCCKFLRSDFLLEESAGTTLAVLVVIDGVCDVVATLFSIFSWAVPHEGSINAANATSRLAPNKHWSRGNTCL